MFTFREWKVLGGVGGREFLAQFLGLMRGEGGALVSVSETS